MELICFGERENTSLPRCSTSSTCHLDGALENRLTQLWHHQSQRAPALERWPDVEPPTVPLDQNTVQMLSLLQCLYIRTPTWWGSFCVFIYCSTVLLYLLIVTLWVSLILNIRSLPQHVFVSEQGADVSQSLPREAETPHLLQPQTQSSSVHQRQTVPVQEWH